MSEIINKARAGLIYWRLVIFKVINGTVKVGVMSYLGATASVRWSDMHADERAVVILTAYVAMSSFLDGFFDQTINQLKSKPSFDTTFIPKPPTQP